MTAKRCSYQDRIADACVLAALAVALAGCGDSAPGIGHGASTTAQLCPSSPPPANARIESACSKRSWTGGMHEVCAGALWYRDYVLDDYGADSNPATATGDAVYPAGKERTADLVDLKVRIEGAELVARFELNALFAQDDAVAALAIDTDNDLATGGGEWPGVGIRSDGWDVFVSAARGSPETNLIELRIPTPPGAAWRLQAVTAQRDGTVMNVAFRGTQETGTWWDDAQAAALAAGDVSEFGACVETADLRNGATRAAAVAPGLHQRVYVSDFTLPPGEGANYTAPVPGRFGATGAICQQAYAVFGRYQPYGIYLPDQPAPHGLQFALHGCGANHTSLIANSNLQQRFGEDLNRIIVVPEGRGPTGFYFDLSEADVLDAWRDVLDTYPVDEDRVFMGGYSMGGYGSMRFSAMYPDRFAGAANWVGFTGHAGNNPVTEQPVEELGPPIPRLGPDAAGNVVNFVGNLRHVPMASLYAGADELVAVWTWTALRDEFLSHEVPFEFFAHPLAEHFTLAGFADWRKEAAYTHDLVRVKNPSRVTYRYEPWADAPALGIVHDRAYWLRDIRARNAERNDYADVDLQTFACGGDAPVYATGARTGVDPVPWVSDYREVIGTQPLAAAPRIEGTLGNVASLTLDADATCAKGRPVAYRIQTDGPVTLRLSDGRSWFLPAAGMHEGTR